MSYNDKFLTLFSKDFDSIDNKCDYDDQNTFNGIGM